MLDRLYLWYGKTVVHGFFLLFFTLTVIGGMFALRADEPEHTIENETGVTVARVGSLQNGRALELIGEVAAVSQDTVTSETSGRVVRVNVDLGDTVRAGQIIAELENASERAAVTQAEGAYESAVAGAAQSDVSVREAENALRGAEQDATTAYRNAYTSVNDVVRNLMDELFSAPEQRVPGLRITGFGSTEYLNTERYALNDELAAWQEESVALDRSDDLHAALSEAVARTNRVLRMVDTFISILPRQDANEVFTESALDSYKNRFTAARSALTSTRSSLDTADVALVNARESLERVRISGTGGLVSAADAQVKQALGSLRSAQAHLEKTILRSSIAGTVNSLTVKQGDFLGAQEVVARVANNNALEVTTYISEAERNSVSVGKSVTLEGRHTGTITNIAPAVDPMTKKIELKIATESDALENGDTVRIAVPYDPEMADENDPITIPITALKAETDREVVFTVGPENTLVAHEVTIGPLLGAQITIESGVTQDMVIVTDARGLNEGDTVMVIEQQ